MTRLNLELSSNALQPFGEAPSRRRSVCFQPSLDLKIPVSSCATRLVHWIVKLQSYDWPGNVRELQNVIERAIIISRSGVLRFDLPPDTSPQSPPARKQSKVETDQDVEVIPEDEMRRRERENLLNALRQSGWKIYGVGGAAELLGVNPTTLSSRIKKLGLTKSGSDQLYTSQSTEERKGL